MRMRNTNYVIGGQAYENAVSGVNGDRNIYNHRDTESCRFTQLGYLANGCNYFDCDRVNLAVRLDSVHIAEKEKAPQRRQSLTAHMKNNSFKE